MSNRHLYWPRGKVLGGSGSLNAMVHQYACAADFDGWRVPGWSAADMFPLRKTLNDAGIHADPVREPNPLSLAFLEACEAAGVPQESPLEDASRPVAGLFRLNVRRGKRWSSADAYLRPALQRGNLTVWTNVNVRRVLLEGNRTTGVEYAQAEAIQTVAAAREVILCAGAIGSPQLLLLSGIGPVSHLESVGVPVAAALEGVGANLQDHLAAPVAHFCMEPVSCSGAVTFGSRWKHRLFGRGPLASNGAEAGVAFKSKAELPACDLEIVFAAGHYVDHGFASPGGHGFSMIPILLTPRSRGTVRLASAEPGDAPRIDPAYLADPDDVLVLAAGVRFVQQVLDQKPLKKYRGAPVQGHLAEPEEHIREWGQTLYHPAGTCKMGSDADSVVDTNLRVHSIVGLRVADASIIPIIPRAHTNATALMIAEKAAQFLRA
ncbi:MAG: GMC family oxidoreductase N-terminal domain-containing protein [Acidobacteriota bacterium]